MVAEPHKLLEQGFQKLGSDQQPYFGPGIAGMLQPCRHRQILLLPNLQPLELQASNEQSVRAMIFFIAMSLFINFVVPELMMLFGPSSINVTSHHPV